MRILIAAPLLLAAACSVQDDPRNGQTTIAVDRNLVTDTGERLGNAVEDTANEVQRAGQAIGNEARRIDVDVDVRRDDQGNSARNSN